jgi:hypothetical protein
LIKLPALQVLDLNFRNFFISEIGTAALAESISKVFSIKKLKINFTECQKITDKTLNDIGNALLNTNLIDLDLNFTNCQKISDKGLALLGTALSKLSKVPGLKRLALNLQSTPITDGGVAKMGQLLTDLPWLDHLEFNFNNCIKLTN